GGGVLAAGVLSSGFKGPCIISTDCVIQCRKENYKDGHCSTWKRQCWCTQKCKNTNTRVAGRFYCRTKNG
ncbi:Knot1 domain-containing protein, partial [Meloidogyne graminicola]